MVTSQRAQEPIQPPIPHTTLAEAGAALAARPYVRRGVPISQRTIRVVLADDHTIFRSALKALLHRAAPEVEVVGEASNGEEALDLVKRLSPDLIVMDLEMPRGDGLTATRALADGGWQVKVLVLTMHTEEERLLPLLRAGARGYLAKDVAERELVDAIRVVAAGDVYVQPSVARLLAASVAPATDHSGSAREQFTTLSEREQTVLRLVAEGFNGPEIGAQLGIAAKTVDTYKQRIEDKLGLGHRTAYVRFAIDAGLLDR
ncbi:response regulator transcription factor [soil metagenome]